MNNLGFLESAVLGLVEGLTEFIPVSSTGHLILASDLLGLSGEKVKVFEVCIQFAAILAVGVLYFKRLIGLLDFSGKKSERADEPGFSGLNGIYCMIAGCLPALIVGYLFGSQIKHLLFYPLPVGVALVAGALLMIFCEKKAAHVKIENLDQLRPRQALLIGLFQTLSLWPGMSRAGTSIAGGLFMGLGRKVSAEFSFLMAVPLISAATVYDIYQNWALFTAEDLKIFLFGAFVAFISAYLAVKIFVALLARMTLMPFAVYRLLIGIIVILYFLPE